MGFPISKCPHCGSTKIMRKERYKGTGYTTDTLSDDPIQAQRDMEDSDLYFMDVEYTFVSKWWVCANCERKLFKQEEITD